MPRISKNSMVGNGKSSTKSKYPNYNNIDDEMEKNDADVSSSSSTRKTLSTTTQKRRGRLDRKTVAFISAYVQANVPKTMKRNNYFEKLHFDDDGDGDSKEIEASGMKSTMESQSGRRSVKKSAVGVSVSVENDDLSDDDDDESKISRKSEIADGKRSSTTNVDDLRHFLNQRRGSREAADERIVEEESSAKMGDDEEEEDDQPPLEDSRIVRRSSPKKSRPEADTMVDREEDDKFASPSNSPDSIRRKSEINVVRSVRKKSPSPEIEKDNKKKSSISPPPASESSSGSDEKEHRRRKRKSSVERPSKRRSDDRDHHRRRSDRDRRQDHRRIGDRDHRRSDHDDQRRGIRRRIEEDSPSIPPTTPKRSKRDVGDEDEDEEKERFTFFFTKKYVFSNHYPCRFKIDDKEFNCTEQYYMYMKAVHFGDTDAAESILSSKEPKEMKRLGSSVQGFDDREWDRSDVSRRYMREANMAKYQQNPHLLDRLFETRGTTLVEASPGDQKWGIGVSMESPMRQDRRTWRGQNWLGQILTGIRDELWKKQDKSE